EDGRSIGCRELALNGISSLSKERVRILELLSRGPKYPAELARIMELPVPTVYYHIRLLEKAELIDFVDYSERNGGVAKRYACNAESLAFIIKPDWKETARPKSDIPPIISPFIKNGFFDGLMVLGSPDPHGRYRARASDLGILELAMYLGQYASFGFPLYMLDRKVKDRGKNLILAGGPKVNTLVAELNPKLPIRFDEKNFEIHS